MTNDKDILITNDKDLVKNIIFDGTEEHAIKMCKTISKYGIYDGFSGFGLYLSKAREDDINNTKKLANELEQILDGQKEETHHVWIVLQQVMKWLAGEASDEFKAKVEK